MVSAELALTNALGISHYILAVGPSLGGMRALEWAIQHPDRVNAICTIGSSAVATGDQIGAASIQIRAIKTDRYYNNGDYYEQELGPVEGMGIARRIAHLTYRTETEMDVRFGRELQGDDTGRFAVESYLDHQAQKLAKRFDANTYIALTEAMNSHDVGRDRGGVAEALATITIPVLVVSIDSDRLFPPRLQEEIVELTPTAEPLVTISSPFGHDGFLIEVETVGEVLRAGLAVGISRNK
jgi:homoserine O-acetyltransferase